LERDAKPKSFGSSIAPSTQIPNEGATKPTTVLKSGTDIQKEALRLREERLKKQQNRR
jgi:hypothetical protein